MKKEISKTEELEKKIKELEEELKERDMEIIELEEEVDDSEEEIKSLVKEGDILTDDKLYTGAGNTGQFRIVKILRQWEESDEEIYRTAIIQSINLDGS